METIFILLNLDTPATANFICSSSKNVFLNKEFGKRFSRWWKRFLSIFLTYLPAVVCSGLVETQFWNEPFILTNGNGFSITYNFVLLFGAFFCWWTHFLKSGINQFSFNFLLLTAEAIFPASRNGFFPRILHFSEKKRIYCCIRLFRANFMIAETIT